VGLALSGYYGGQESTPPFGFSKTMKIKKG
jgi:hypothetical protein